MFFLRLVVLIILRLSIPVVLVSGIVFFLLRAVPGNPASVQQGLRATQTIEQNTFGEIVSDYGRWLGNAARFDFGRSEYTSQRSGALVMPYLFRTTLLAIAALIGSLCFSLALVICALRYNWPIVSGTIVGGARIIIAIPEFWLALLLVWVFTIKIQIFPVFGGSTIIHYILPLATLAMSRGAVLVELLYGSLMDTKEQLYTTAASDTRIGILENSLPLLDQEQPVCNHTAGNYSIWLSLWWRSHYRAGFFVTRIW